MSLLLLHLLLATARFDGAVRTEVQAGESPTPSDPDSVPFVAVSVRPELTVDLRTPTTRTRVFEATRFLLRLPNAYGRTRPLYLNTLQAEHHGASGRRLRWDLQVTSLAGQMDYAALAQALGRQATLPQTLDLFSVDATALLGWRLSRRLEVSGGLVGLRRQPLWGSESSARPAGLGLPTETNLGVEPQLDYALSRRQAGQIRVKLASYRLTGTLDLWALAAELRLGWRYQLNRHQGLQLRAGVAVATARQRSDPSLPWSSLAPLGEVAWTLAKSLSRWSLLRASAGGEVLWYLEPVLGVALPRALARAELALAFGQAWLLGLRLLAATNLSGQPIPGRPFETLLSAAVPLRYRLGQHWLVDFGAIYSERGPHLTAPAFSLRQRELYGYLALTVTTQ